MEITSWHGNEDIPLISKAFCQIPITILEDHDSDDIWRFIDNEVASMEPLSTRYQIVWDDFSHKAIRSRRLDVFTNLLERSKTMPEHERYAMSAILALIILGALKTIPT